MKRGTIIFWTGVAAIVALGGYVIYDKFIRDTDVLTKEKAADVIIAQVSTAKKSTLMGFQDGFVKAWAKAILNQQSTFQFEGKNYSASTGKTI